ncbi:hypothetical protein HAV15_011201 [Penicillium sp. str. |nr:hypothetical protein HAV15_011201 [Penicillium sp. str. \
MYSAGLLKPRHKSFLRVLARLRNSNSGRDWNCQNWVGEVLTELVKIGCLTKEERAAAIGKIVETILEKT